MHILQPKHSRLKPEEVKKLLERLNISLAQLPKISKNDPFVGEDFQLGDVMKIDRKNEKGEVQEYFRVVV